MRAWVSVAAVAAGGVLAPAAVASAAVSVYPPAGTPDVATGAQVSFRGAPVAEVAAATVTGSRSGPHTGRWLVHSDGGGASLLPSKPFSAGETVTVDLPATSAGGSEVVRFQVAGTTPRFSEPTQRAQHRFPRGVVQRFRSRPDLVPPRIVVTRRGRGASGGDLFVAPKLGPSQQGPMLLGPGGALLWFQPLAGDQQAFDFRTQLYRGAPVLTWWQGGIQGFHGRGAGVILDSSYRRIATVRAADGYAMDLHEFTLTPNGTALITVYQAVPANLSSVGGPKNGLAYDGIVQEIDVATGAVEFEWHSLGHVPLRDSYLPLHVPGFNTPAYDYFHVNSVELEPDGNLLVSARHTHAVYEIDRASGRVLWQLGGKHSGFRLGRDVGFSWQHDARRGADGTISLFDNAAAAEQRGVQSRAIVVRLDQAAHTATLVRDYRHGPPLLAPTQGSAQVLGNGDMLVGWGGTNQSFSEYSRGGGLLFDARFAAPGTESYRAYRLPWSGTPASPPRAAAQRTGRQTLVWASWNGATRVARWRVLAGARPNALARTGPDTRATGFETRIAVAGAHPFAAVQALDAAGRLLGTSASASASVRRR